MQNDKQLFIKYKIVPQLLSIPADTMGKWGKMNAQQMTEHLSDFFKVSSGKLKFSVVTPLEHLPKFKAFLLSDKEFRENTKAPENVIPEEPVPVRNASMSAALDELNKEINDFINYFKDNTEAKTTHPVFGELVFDEWVSLHYKHATHHLKQFGL